MFGQYKMKIDLSGYFSTLVFWLKWGVCIKNNQKMLGKCISRWVSLVSIIAFYAFKYAYIWMKPILMPLQFIEQILLGLFMYSLIPFLLRIEPKLQQVSKQKRWRIMVFISSITLEIFLIMDYVIMLRKRDSQSL